MLILYEFTLTIIFRQHLQIKGITICKHAPGLLQITLSIYRAKPQDIGYDPYKKWTDSFYPTLIFAYICTMKVRHSQAGNTISVCHCSLLSLYLYKI